MTLQGPTVVVKLGLDGQSFVDGQSAPRAQLLHRVGEVARAGGFVTYYREAPETEGTDEAAATFRAMIDLKPAIRLGNHAPSEWGRLDWVEIEEAPQVARLFLARGQKFLISRPPTPTEPKPPVIVGGPMSPEKENDALNPIDFLLSSDRVMETPVSHPEMAMAAAGQGERSLHFRVAYDTRRWASWYRLGEEPSNIRSFYEDVWRYARRLVGSFETPETPLPAEQARRFFDSPERSGEA